LRAGSHVVSRFGPEREAWDRVFPEALLDRLSTALFAMPAAARSRHRRQAFAAALAELPEGFPQTAASDQAIAAAATRFANTIPAAT
jgi:N-methylhydantoinase B